MSQKSDFEKGMEGLEFVGQTIRELQTQLTFQKGIDKVQQQQLHEVKEYAEQLRYNHPTIAGELRRILNLKDCATCAVLLENCTCPQKTGKCYICGKDSGSEIYCSQKCSDYSNGKGNEY